MNDSWEVEAVRAEQRRLRAAVDRLDERISTLESRIPPRFSPPPPRPEPVVPAASRLEPATPSSAAPPPIPLESARPAAAKASAPTPEPRESFELRLGRVWLVRLGIVILLTGFVFLGNYAYHEFVERLGPIGKLLLIYLAGGALGALGVWCARGQASLRAYGRVLLAGGCATIYYATYAAHFVDALRVIESPGVGGALLLGLGGIFVAAAERIRSQTLAAATVALAFYTSAINPVETFSLFSNLVISAGAVLLLVRRSWSSVSFLSLAGAYGSFAFWRLQQTGSLLPTSSPETFWPAVLFPAAYWLVHTAAVMLRRTGALDPAAKPAFLTLNNAAFFALAGPVVAGTYPDAFWLAAILYGGVLLVLGAFASRQARDEPFFDGSYLSQGLGLICLGGLLHFTGWQQAISFALLAGTLLSLGRLRHAAIYRFFSGLSAVVSACSAFANVLHGEPQARLTAGAVAVLLGGLAWLLRRQLGAPKSMDWRVLGFALLSSATTLPALIDVDFQASGLRLLALATALLVARRFLRLPELIHSSQPLALAGQSFLVAHAVTHSFPPATLLASAAFGVASVHLWQADTLSAPIGRRIWQTLHVLPPVLLALLWGCFDLDLATRGPVFALLALALLVYGPVTRTRILATAAAPLAIAASGCTALSIAELLPWWSPALCGSAFLAQSLLIRFALPSTGRPWATPLAQTLRVGALGLGAWMVLAYIPAGAQFLALVGAAFVLFCLACVTRSGETLLHAAALALVAGAAWLGRLPFAPPSPMDFLGFLLVAGAQRLGRRRLVSTGWFGPGIQTALCTAVVLGSWLLLHRLVATPESGFLLTVSWSLLALAVLGAGFAWKERAYRLLGLVVLAGAVGRVFCIDVWQLDTLARIVSLLVLGGVLLALSFLYNRYAEALKRWL